MFGFWISSGCGHYSGLPFEESTDDSSLLSRNKKPPQQDNDEGFDSNSVSFVTFGDWGADRNEPREVALAIGDYCLANPCDFILTLGDNFYSSGVESVTDELWTERFHNVYDFLGLLFYAVLGNHDTYGPNSFQPQIDYTNEVDNWIMPAEHYSFSKPDNVNPPLVQFFTINSEDITNWDDQDAEDLTQVDADIVGSQARWKIFAMHHPIYSNGRHGDTNNGSRGYNDHLLPLICDRIDLVLSGHDHNFGHLRSDADGCLIEQLVVGTGGQQVREVDQNDPRVLSSASMYGFGWLQVSQNQILFRMIDTAGQTFYETTFTKP